MATDSSGIGDSAAIEINGEFVEGTEADLAAPDAKPPVETFVYVRQTDTGKWRYEVEDRWGNVTHTGRRLATQEEALDDAEGHADSLDAVTHVELHTPWPAEETPS